jgi:hypothetical protein
VIAHLVEYALARLEQAERAIKGGRGDEGAAAAATGTG